MVETHFGFQGNYILAEQLHWGDFGPKDWGEDTWRIWPVVSMMARDKVLLNNARYADQPLREFAVLPDGIARSVLGDYTVWANEAPDQEWLAPGGCWGTERQCRLSAGILTGFNGQPLAAGDHWLIVETRDDGLTVRQPQGSDTPLVLKTAKPVRRVTARCAQGTAAVTFRVADGQVSLEICGKLQGQDVRSYELSCGE